MGNAWRLLALGWALAVIRPCPAGTLIDTDFRDGSSGWSLNGDARVQRIDGQQLLTLTQNELDQNGAAWSALKRRVPSFSFIADIRVRFHPPAVGACPADGLTLVFADAEPDTLAGTGGGDLGLFRGGIERFTCMEVNSWPDQGLGSPVDRTNCTSGKNETFAFGLITPEIADQGRNPGQYGTPENGGPKIGQVLPPSGMKIVNGGWYRYQWNVDGTTNTMSVTVTGLEAKNRQFRKVEVLKLKFLRNPIDFEGRFGLTAATGGSVQQTEVAAVRIAVPLVDP